jgi:uncharacterized membrane protein YgdD (TMEM256/DUF423 family)
MTLSKIYLALAGLSGFLAVALGAFGSHGLKEKLSEASMSVWHTSVQYHFYHTLLLLAVAFFLQRATANTWLLACGGLVIAGLLLFCGSLYGLALGGPRWLGPITPLGGLCFLIAWACLAIYGFKLNS